MSTTEGPVAEFKARLAETAVSADSLARFLDDLSPDPRIRVIRSLGRSEQRRLYERVDGFRLLALADLVPPDAVDFAPVRHYGKNTLPVFSQFEKRFCRPPGADHHKPNELYGYNFQSMQPLTGPGYFIARPAPDRPEIWVDYNRVPDTHPDGWPEIRSNERGLSRFVYGFMIDTLRRVSEHVTIGSAARKGVDLGSWFVLCREA